MLLPIIVCFNKADRQKVLLFHGTCGFRHPSITTGTTALDSLLRSNGIQVTSSDDPAMFEPAKLAMFSSIVFLSTVDSGNCLFSSEQQAALEQYVNNGGGFVGIHAASDAGYQWPWYGYLVGAYFAGHPPAQRATVNVLSNPLNNGLPSQWQHFDEWYNFQWIDTTVTPLLWVDEKTYNGGMNPPPHLISWYHDVGQGRSFYTALGHTEECYRDPFFLKHVLSGVKYAIGSKAYLKRYPKKKEIVRRGALNEPVQFLFWDESNVLIAERNGSLKSLNIQSKKMETLITLPVFTQAELGLMGICRDPDPSLPYIYSYYTPLETDANRLSRFTMENGKIQKESEKIILQIPVDKQWCCHTGGTITFDDQRNLLLSTGDNTIPFNPFNEKVKSRFVDNGFSPMDERIGYEGYNALRSAANTNDLRGKIIRIKIDRSGNYTIPSGNLFSSNDSSRPEIFVMGCRNPYRLSFDKKYKTVYWGDVGPDAPKDSNARGPRGYDEINRTSEAGFFGWPMFTAENLPYRQYNYVSGESGDYFNAGAPMNLSRLNTGSRQLPPAQKAWFAYSYDLQPGYPDLGSGARCIMAGPVVRNYKPPSDTSLPESFNNRLFVYDWSRGWIKTMPVDNPGKPVFIDFPGGERYSGLIDMKLGPDGLLYLLEYGPAEDRKHQETSFSSLSFQRTRSSSTAVRPKLALGAYLYNEKGCKACHQLLSDGYGPSFKNIQRRYKTQGNASNLIIAKIINGGSGNWGRHSMPAHPGLKKNELEILSKWILQNNFQK